MKKIILSLIFGLSGLANTLLAQQYNKASLDSLLARIQNPNSKSVKFLLTGYTQTTVKYVPDKEFSVNSLSFNPIFLWRPTDKIFFEGELESALAGQGLEIGLEYADITYKMNRYMNFRVGKFLAPFGVFQDRYHPAWINRLSTRPLGFDEESSVGALSEIGININGGVPIGPSKFNYSFYITNGPQLNTGREEASKAGTLMYGQVTDNNINKAVGGRVGYLPFSNSSLELGGSFMTAKVGDKDSVYQNVKATLLSLDLTYVKSVTELRGMIDVKAQWNSVDVGTAKYKDLETDPTGNASYTFNNKRSTVYGQLAYRPTLAKSKFVKNLELVYRYSMLHLPDGAKEEGTIKQNTYGLNYWINYRSVMKFAVQSQESQISYFVQWALLF